VNDAVESWVTVIPAPGALVETAQQLLAAADDPQHVLTQGNGDHFLVAPYIADAYNTPLKKRPARGKKAGDQ
jgi:hypothetical protein